jgi:hypothetical protein
VRHPPSPLLTCHRPTPASVGCVSCRPPGPPPPRRLLSTRSRAAPGPPLSFSLFPHGCARTLSPLSLCLGAKAAAPPFPIPSLSADLAAPKPLPLPLAPTWLGAHFPALDSAAPHRKLPRSRRRPALSGELRPARRGLHLRGCLTPPFCSLLLRDAGACHGPQRPPCGLPHRSSTAQPPSPHPAGAPRHGDALGAHLICVDAACHGRSRPGRLVGCTPDPWPRRPAALADYCAQHY